MGDTFNALHDVVYKIFDVGPGKQQACKNLFHEVDTAVRWYFLRCIPFPIQEDCNYR